ncbi:response regulator transcription factor [Hephaestia mangrovi]|uniref:response regulator transcription factor n=1 Tax=Hephaestia mangrovi TaxID=2873268 RepID=UPI001CA6460A|nr:response regulator transcription factor [Hephaestia mangrovi]MBY8828585.1 response regulator transcription factor [Hephaestia mangrovi]
MRIAIVEDDAALASILETGFVKNGHECTVCADGLRFLSMLQRETYDLILLDWHLPDISGLKLIEMVRAGNESHLPILVYTGSAAERDMLAALRAGADDYVTKPVTLEVLLARIEALARRAYPATPQGPVSDFGDYTFDHRLETVVRDGEHIQLTPKEYALALLLFQNMSRPLSRTYLVSTVWGWAHDAESRTLDSHISRIRSKLGLEPANGFRLFTLYGHGYRLVSTTS